MQRKRRLSESDACAVEPPRKRIPLTVENLIRLQQSITPSNQAESMAGSRPPTPSGSRTSGSKATASSTNQALKLRTFGIRYEIRKPLPKELSELVTRLKEARPTGSISPNAKNVADQVLYTRQSEQDGIERLVDGLLLGPATKNSEHSVGRAAKANLSRQFLPQPRRDAIDQTRHLETPQPDHAFGYLHMDTADRLGLPSPLTFREESIMEHFALTGHIHFPFLTAQWKSSAKLQTHNQAVPQGARDGAAVVNYLHDFFSTGRPKGTKPSYVETCHFSATIDMRTIMLWIHWREEDATTQEINHYMEWIACGFLEIVEDNEKIRTIIRNLQDHAMGERLAKIKEHIPKFGVRHLGVTLEEEGNAHPEMMDPQESNANPDIANPREITATSNPDIVKPRESNASPEIVKPPSPVTGNRRALPLSPASLLTSPGHYGSPPRKRSRPNLQNPSEE